MDGNKKKLHFVKNVTYSFLDDFQLLKQGAQFLRHGIDHQPGESLFRSADAGEYPFDSHVYTGLTVHFQKGTDFITGKGTGLFPDQIPVEIIDHAEIMILQAVLAVAAEGGRKEQFFLVDIFKLADQAFIDRTAAAETLKGFIQYDIEIPVDQIVTVPETAVERLPRHAADIADLSDRDIFHRRCLHAFLDGICQSEFCLFASDCHSIGPVHII